MSGWKDLIQLVIRNILRPIGSLLGIKRNRILLWSYRGYQYSCSPKYLSQYIQDHCGEEFEMVWAFRDPQKWTLPDGIRKIRYRSLLFFYYHFTAGFIVTNIFPIPLAYTRKGQFLIDTWHGGGAYKVAGFDNHDDGERRQLEFSRQNISVFVSSSKMFSDCFIRGGMRFEKEILNAGLPRNDIFFYSPKKKALIVRNVRQRLGLGESGRILLYAPTWRNRTDCSEFYPDRLQAALETRFGGHWTILFRKHLKTESDARHKVMDVSDYPDMQELLLMSDALITDYSSSIWDYSLTAKPCFLYAYDLGSYRKGRDFYIDIRDWGFPVCKCFDDLLAAIKNFDACRHRQKMQEHYRMMGGYDRGTACEIVTSYIREHAKSP